METVETHGFNHFDCDYSAWYWLTHVSRAVVLLATKCLDSVQALMSMQVASYILIILGNVHWPVEISTAAENRAISSSVSCSEHKLLAKSNTALTKSSQPWRETQEREGQTKRDFLLLILVMFLYFCTIPFFFQSLSYLELWTSACHHTSLQRAPCCWEGWTPCTSAPRLPPNNLEEPWRRIVNDFEAQ